MHEVHAQLKKPMYHSWPKLIKLNPLLSYKPALRTAAGRLSLVQWHANQIVGTSVLFGERCPFADRHILKYYI